MCLPCYVMLGRDPGTEEGFTLGFVLPLFLLSWRCCCLVAAAPSFAPVGVASLHGPGTVIPGTQSCNNSVSSVKPKAVLKLDSRVDYRVTWSKKLNVCIFFHWLYSLLYCSSSFSPLRGPHFQSRISCHAVSLLDA